MITVATYINALTGMSAAMITLLLVFEYLERPNLQRRVHRILWGIQQPTDKHRWYTIVGEVGGYAVVHYDDDPVDLTHLTDIKVERIRP